MYLQKKLRSVENYLNISKQLTNGPSLGQLRILARIVLYRLLFGHNASFYSIYKLNEKPFSQCSEYLSKKRLKHLQRKIINSQYLELVDNKLAFYERCRSNSIPTPDILAIISETNFNVPHNIPVLNDKDSLSALFARYDSKMLFFKVIDGVYGIDAFSVKLKDGNAYDPFGKKLTLEAILSQCLKYNRRFLVQEHLRPHEDVKVLMPGPAIGTFRLVTILSNDKKDVKIPYAFMKVPVRGNIVDNFKHGETGNLLCGIDVGSGEMMDARGMRKGEHSILNKERHPDTQVRFKDITIPFWSEILTLVAQGAKVFSELKTLGWDVAITDEGIYLMEANCWYDPDGPQITLDKGVKTEINQLYSS